jgi:phosphate transport system substrate-binding protein
MIVLRVGEPASLSTSAFQLGKDAILVGTNPQNPVTGLSEMQIREIFSGQIDNWSAVNGADAPVNVWVYAREVDIQQVFQAVVMDNLPISSSARLATSPHEMAQALANDSNAIGIMSEDLILFDPTLAG